MVCLMPTNSKSTRNATGYAYDFLYIFFFHFDFIGFSNDAFSLQWLLFVFEVV